MARYCADCTYLKVDDKGNGKYKCTKIKKDVLANMDACEKFEMAYARKRYDREKYYDLAKNITEKYKGLEPGTLLLIAFLLGLLLLICEIFM